MLDNDSRIPAKVFGTFLLNNKTKENVVEAVQVGYRHIDTAALYGNEVGVGEGIQEAIKSLNITRGELFVTGKAWCSQYRIIRQACVNSLKRLSLEYFDLYLLHWPICLQPDYSDQPSVNTSRINVDRFPLYLVWNQMEQLVDERLVKNIGVSNWTIALLNDLLSNARIRPLVNQIEIHPYNKRKELVEFCQHNKVIPIGYRVIFRPQDLRFCDLTVSVLDNNVITDIAARYNKTSAQIIQAWCLKRNCGVITKTESPKRLLENFNSDFDLDESDFVQINSIPDAGIYTDPFPFFGIPLFH